MKINRHLVAAIAGNALEYYDVMLYGFFAATLAPLFFPSDSKAISIMASFGTFAASFLMRPLGAALFGHLGDRLGRQKALILSILVVAIPTSIIGLLPTYAQIGFFAPITLVLCRLLQGICMGGEYSGAAIFIVEHAKEQKTGFRGSILCASGSIGAMIGTSLGLFFTLDFMPSWGWRIPFLVGSFLGIVGYFLRRQIEETPVFKIFEKTNRPVRVPLLEAIKKGKRNFILNVFLSGAVLVPFYLASIYMSPILLNQFKLSNATLMGVNTFLMFLQTIMVLIMGWYSDILGQVKLVQLSSLVLALFAYPVFKLLTADHLSLVLCGQAILCLIGPGVVAPMTGLMPRMFPVRFRYSGLAFSTCIGAALIGGTTPLIATALAEITHNPMSPTFYLAASGLIIFLTVSKLPAISDISDTEHREKAFS